jgi:hypothetical protein
VINPREIDLTCKELVEIVTDYFSFRMSAPDRVLFEQHILICPACSQYVDQLRETMAMTGKLREDDVPGEVAAELGSVFKRWKQSKGKARPGGDEP